MTIELIVALFVSVVFFILSISSLFHHSRPLVWVILIYGIVLIVATLFYFWRRHWKKRLGRIIFTMPLWRGFYMHGLLFFTGASAIVLIGGGEDYRTMVDCAARMILPMFVIFGWEAGNPKGAGAIAIFSIVTLLFLANGVFNFGSVLVPSIAKFFSRRKKVKYENHIVVWGCNTHLDEVVEQMSNPALGRKRRPIVVIVDVNFMDEAKSIVRRYLDVWDDIYVIQGTALDISDLENAAVKDAFAILLLPPEKEENPDLSVSLAAMTVWDFLEGLKDENRPRVIVKVDSPSFASRITRVADKVICASRRDFLLAAEAVFFPVVVDVYSDLMKISEDTNEIYVTELPDDYAGRTYEELVVDVLKNTRGTKNPATVIGIQRGKELFLNPSSDKLMVLEKDDKVLVMSMENLDLARVLSGSNG